MSYLADHDYHNARYARGAQAISMHTGKNLRMMTHKGDP